MSDNTMNVNKEPGSDASKAYRKSFATVLAAYRTVAIESYYGERASVINYPISNTSWAAPQPTDDGYKVAFSVDVNGNDIYTECLCADEKYAAIMQYLSQNPTEQISIDDQAARFYISKYHMMRRFRAETGYTVHAYLTGKRLALARELIAAGTPILQAASACGFGDYSAFCRAYRRQFGQPPSSAKQDAAETPKSRKKA